MTEKLVYFTSVSGNTKRFVEKLKIPATQIPLYPKEQMVEVNQPFVLVLPTYGSGTPAGAVPKQVIKFLNIKGNRDLCRGVIVTGNTNFGTGYGIAGKIVAEKLNVPLLYKLELFGTPEDVKKVKEGLEQFWKHQ